MYRKISWASALVLGSHASTLDCLPCTPGLHSCFILQAREAGKAVRIGRGPATVIGCRAVSQATLPCRGDCAFREKGRRREPHRLSHGAFSLAPFAKEFRVTQFQAGHTLQDENT